MNLFGFETQIENSKIEIMETDCKSFSQGTCGPSGIHKIEEAIQCAYICARVPAHSNDDNTFNNDDNNDNIHNNNNNDNDN